METEAGSPGLSVVTINTTPVAFYEGPMLATEQDAIDVIGATFGLDIEMVVLPAAKLPDAFFRLRTGFAGAVLQKFVNYGLRVGVVGDLSSHTKASQALRDFVVESNRGGHILFVTDVDALGDRLEGGRT